ncbi:MAG: patatin-like phospholipase family protein [Candidatus Omnitrophica bacterium]|nr:patatin-like phospholipase family protein [Candidatus Omnitrophota bacterium]
MGRRPLKIALALGGGGVRGLAHIGIIKELEKDIPIDFISGTSMGALVGAHYALNKNIDLLEKKVLGILERKEVKDIEKVISGDTLVEEKKLIIQNLIILAKKIFLLNLRAIKRWMFSGKEIAWIFDELGFNVDFGRTKIPFCCLGADLRTGEEVIMNTGRIRDAVLASLSLPGVFPPVKRGRHLLVDGGIIGSVPVDAAKTMGADIIIAVGVEAQVDYNRKLGNGLDIMFQADAIRAYKLYELRLKNADLVIYPDVAHITWASFSRAKECINEGRKAAQKMKPQIVDLIKRKNKSRFWKSVFFLNRGKGD